MSPEGRAKQKAFSKMTAGMEVWRLMRKDSRRLCSEQEELAAAQWLVRQLSSPGRHCGRTSRLTANPAAGTTSSSRHSVSGSWLERRTTSLRAFNQWLVAKPHPVAQALGKSEGTWGTVMHPTSRHFNRLLQTAPSPRPPPPSSSSPFPPLITLPTLPLCRESAARARAWNCWEGRVKSWLCARKGFGHLRNRGLSLGWRSWSRISAS